MNRYFQNFEKKALCWNDIEGANELRQELDNFNKKVNFDLFTWHNSLIRSSFTLKPYKFPAFFGLPNELKDEEKRLSNKLNLFIKKGTELVSNEEKVPYFDDDLTVEDYNNLLEKSGFASYNDFIELRISFRDINNISSYFQITYGTLSEYKISPSFEIYAMNKPYCGNKDQEYENILPDDSPFNDFWNKWICYHMESLTKDEYQELISDIQMLKEYINYIPQSKIIYEKNSI